MRKTFTLVAALFLLAGMATAQTTTKSGKKRWGHFGFKSGINFTSFRLNGADTKSSTTEGRTGFAFGAFEKIPLNDKFDFQPEFYYSAQGGTIYSGIGFPDIYKLNYFSVPLLLKYNFFDGVKILGGPELDFLIKGKKSTGGVVLDETNNINAASVAFTAGVEKWFGKFVSLQGRYIYGINDVNKRSTTYQFINKGFHVSLGILLQ